MQSDDYLSEDEEEMLVYVEFEDFVGSKTFLQPDLQLDMIGIDTEHPVMKVNGRVRYISKRITVCSAQNQHEER